MVFKSQFADSKPASEYKDLVSNYFWHQLDKFRARCLLVDYKSGRHWNGAQIKHASATIARNLIALVGLRPQDDCVFFYKNGDHIYLASLATLFAGGSVCVGEPGDPEHEHSYMLRLMRPAVVFVTGELVQRMRSLRSKLDLAFRIVAMDDDNGWQRGDSKEFGFHTHLMRDNNQVVELPVQIPADKAAFVLFSSGSTGNPKAVSRSQRNSLYVCHSLPAPSTSHVWRLDESSVLAGHLQLDHGTGTFSLKMTLAKGLKLILMERYEPGELLEACERHQITDCMLGSALLHNLIVELLLLPANESGAPRLASLRNLIAVGSPIVCAQKAAAFMQAFPHCSLRQAYGMTECGFVSIVERERALTAAGALGPLLPNLAVKLVDRGTGAEVCREGAEGELFISGPTVAPGYLGAEFEECSRHCFQADGFYKTNDICQLEHDQRDQVCRLRIRGRYSEVLCLYDGWKVLPAELEALIMEHPRVLEAAVVGVPHPTLPTCHAARAYIVPKRASPSSQSNGSQSNNGSQSKRYLDVSEEEIFQFVASRVAEPKRLIGGIKFMKELPRISIGKVDKKLLRHQDGYA